MMRQGALAALVVLLGISAPAAPVAAEETFVGNITVSEGAQPTRLTLTIRDYTSDDQALALAQRLHQAGHAAAVAELAKADVGTVKLGEGPGLRATLVRQEKTATGRTLRVFAEKPLQPSGAKAPATLPPDAFGYIELQLNAAGEGSGRLMSAARAMFDAEGYVVPENLGQVWPVSNVKPGP